MFNKDRKQKSPRNYFLAALIITSLLGYYIFLWIFKTCGMDIQWLGLSSTIPWNFKELSTPWVHFALNYSIGGILFSVLSGKCLLFVGELFLIDPKPFRIDDTADISRLAGNPDDRKDHFIDAFYVCPGMNRKEGSESFSLWGNSK